MFETILLICTIGLVGALFAYLFKSTRPKVVPKERDSLNLPGGKSIKYPATTTIRVGPIVRPDTVDRNGRSYPSDVIDQAVQRYHERVPVAAAFNYGGQDQVRIIDLPIRWGTGLGMGVSGSPGVYGQTGIYGSTSIQGRTGVTGQGSTGMRGVRVVLTDAYNADHKKEELEKIEYKFEPPIPPKSRFDLLKDSK